MDIGPQSSFVVRKEYHTKSSVLSFSQKTEWYEIESLFLENVKNPPSNMVKFVWGFNFLQNQKIISKLLQNTKKPKIHEFRSLLFLENVKKKTVGIFTSVGNVKKWFVKVSNKLDNYLRSYDNLKFTKSILQNHTPKLGKMIMVSHVHYWVYFAAFILFRKH